LGIEKVGVEGIESKKPLYMVSYKHKWSKSSLKWAQGSF